MHPDTDQPPAWPATTIRWSTLLLWIALGLGGWIVIAAVAVGVYLAVALLV